MWVNKDGLPVKFGTAQAHSLADAGDYKTFDGKGEGSIEIELDLTKLTEAEQILSDVVAIPKNAQITKVEVLTEIAATDGVAIDIGLIQRDRSTTTDLGPTVILAAFPIAQMNAVGETSRFYETHTEPTSMTGTGAAIGQIVPHVAYLTGSRTTSTAFGAGRIKIRIGYVAAALANN